MKIKVCDWGNDTETEIGEYSRVEFGEGAARITVSVRDGIVEISGEDRLHIQPRAANVIWVESKRQPTTRGAK